MTKHSATTHGRYTCPINCPVGSPLSLDQTKCICGPCWEGTTCQTPKCAHGEKVGCPNHGTHCRHNERICLCPIDSSDGNPSYTGKHCEHAFDPEAMPASDVAKKMETQAAVDRAAADEAAALAAKAEKPCDGMKCDDDDVLSSSSSMLNMMLNTTSCECVCSPPFMGAACDMCPTCSSPLHVPDLDNNCECSCADQNMTCQNEGWLNKETCTCSCVNHFSGKECNICEEKNCENDGEFNKDLCSCLCPKGWKGKSCGECDEETTCDNGGRRNMDTCSCACNQDQLQKNLTTHWKGDFCEVSFVYLFWFSYYTPPPPFFTILPTIESNRSPHHHYPPLSQTCPSSNFVDCGNFLFDSNTCQCTEQCEPIDCTHEALLNPKTCQCDCNNGVNITDPKVISDYQQIKGVTFYGGEDCSECVPPLGGCPGGRSFNTANCTCLDACQNPPKCSAAERKSESESSTTTTTMVVGDGVLNEDTCTCDCAPGWGGTSCDQVADGSSRMLAAVSCQAAMVVIDEGPTSPAKSKLYWINPSGTNFKENSFQVQCDMSSRGEGWTLMGNFDGSQSVTPSVYANGRDPDNVVNTDNGGFHVHACEKFHGLDGSDAELRSVVVRLTMGKVVDYYRPRGSTTLCEMLQSNDKHQWWVGAGKGADFEPPTKYPGGDEQGIGDEEEETKEEATKEEETKPTSLLEIEETVESDDNDNDNDDDDKKENEEEEANRVVHEWITPTYEQDPKLQTLLGGSNRTWSTKYDGRAYLSFWGGSEAVKGGCCYDDSKWFRVGVCSSNLDLPCFDDEECRTSESAASAVCNLEGGPRQIGWGKSFTLHLREVVLPGEGRTVSDDVLDQQKKKMEEVQEEPTTSLIEEEKKKKKLDHVEPRSKLDALKEYNSALRAGKNN